jgi:MarR family transcriptional regulator, organic hydroperoxide resistance regulator
VSTRAPEAEAATQQEELPAYEQLGRAFKAALAAVRRLQGRDAHRPGNELRHAQYGLLFGLREHQQLSLSELADAASLSPAAATEMLDPLLASGLVKRERSERDRRQVLISLTARGEALVEQRRAQYEPRWRAALGEFSEQELRTAASVLDRLRHYFEELKEL